MSKKIILTGSIALLILLVYFVFIKEEPNTPPNVVLIVMDTVRRDHLSCYGYPRNTSPRLDQLVKDSRLYSNAYTPGGWTIPAHASIFTGLHTISHGASQENVVLDTDLTTLAEILSENGYSTVGIIGNPNLDDSRNYGQGFQKYYELWNEVRILTGNSGYFFFKKYLAGHDKAKPFFMFINFIEAHQPYNSSQNFYHQFLSDSSIQLESNEWTDYFLKRREFSSAEMEHLRELYDAEILYVDYWIGQMIDLLKKEHLWDDTVLIVTSDHGENFGEHDMVDHAFSLHEPVIRIPLLIHYPTLFEPNSVDSSAVQLTDLFPTVLHLCDIDATGYPSQGRDLLDSEASDDMIFSEYYYPYQALYQNFASEGIDDPILDQFKRRIKTVISGGMKLIYSDIGNHELYDLRRDPHELENLIDDPVYSDTKQDLMDKLEECVDDYSNPMKSSPSDSIPRTEQELDSTTIEALRSLGYVR